jgi:hypothetical protein
MGILIGSFLGLMLFGLPVALAMMMSSLLYILISGSVPDVILAQRVIAGVESFPLLAVPFFILAGNLMNIAGITGRIYNFAVALVGWMRGGLGQVNIIGSVVFAGMSGTAIADAAGLGTIEIKAMKDHGYSSEFSVGVTAASATLGPIIPPSLPFVIYGMMANVSIGSLFLAGLIPGLVMTVFMMATVAYIARRNNWGGDTVFSWKKLGSAGTEILVVLAFPLAIWLMTRAGVSVNLAAGIALVALLALDWYFDFSAVMALMAPVILIGGMTLGWFTPTEAAMAAVIWALFLSVDDVQGIDQSDLRHHRNHGKRAVHRDRGIDFCVAVDHQPGGAAAGRLDPRLHAKQMGVPAAGQRADPGRRMLHRYHCRHHDPGADPAADRAQARHRPDPLWLDHDAEPDDRAAASAARHGAVCAGAGGEAVCRTNDDRDIAVAGPAVPGADCDYLHS